MAISINSGSNAIISSKTTHSYCKHTKGTTRYFKYKIKMPEINVHKKKNYKFKVGQSFDRIMAFCEKQVPLDSFSSKENLNKILTPLFIKTLLKETKKDKIRNSLEENPCFGDYWKDLHKQPNGMFSLHNLQKLYLCLESFCYPIPKTAEEMVACIQEQTH